MLPTREQAEKLLREAEGCNPGPWGDHSRVAAACAEKIAAACGLDSEKAYIVGLLHDIGRRFGVSHVRHVYDGWRYMTELGYDEAARVCLSHSFIIRRPEDYVGEWDVTPEQENEMLEALYAMEYDIYDDLIQLCDSLAMAEGPADMVVRMGDVKRRYGRYPQDKWDANLAMKEKFEKMAGENIYRIVSEDEALWGK